MSSSSPPPPPHVVEDCLGILRLLSDGSIIRTTSTDTVHPVPIIDDGTIIWKDFLFNPTHNLHLRVYKPATNNNDKLPILFYFHPGGFCMISRTWPNIHNCCLRLASSLSAVVVAPDYRLAPEHRLPAAIDDAVSVVDWFLVKSTSADPDLASWMATNTVDFSKVFISGESSGANIAHHLAIHFGPSSNLLPPPVKIRGYILLNPFFGGSKRTKSEVNDDPLHSFLNVNTFEQLWRLALPAGSGADHPLANPVGPEGLSLEAVRIGPVLVVIGGLDVLRDRQVEYAERLKEWGKDVEVVVVQGQMHGFFSMDSRTEAADDLVRAVDRFMAQNSQE